jgi:hypothetical protein
LARSQLPLLDFQVVLDLRFVLERNFTGENGAWDVNVGERERASCRNRLASKQNVFFDELAPQPSAA